MDKFVREVFTCNIQELMKIRGVNNVTLAKGIGVSKSTITTWFKEGGTVLPNIENVYECAKFLNASIDELVAPNKDAVYSLQAPSNNAEEDVEDILPSSPDEMIYPNARRVTTVLCAIIELLRPEIRVSKTASNVTIQFYDQVLAQFFQEFTEDYELDTSPIVLAHVREKLLASPSLAETFYYERQFIPRKVIFASTDKKSGAEAKVGYESLRSNIKEWFGAIRQQYGNDTMEHYQCVEALLSPGESIWGQMSVLATPAGWFGLPISQAEIVCIDFLANKAREIEKKKDSNVLNFYNMLFR